MRFNNSKIIYGALFLGSILLSACSGGGGNSSAAAPAEDSVTIVTVSPTSADASVSTTFAVEVSYSLVTKDSGMLMIGFNTTAVDSYSMLADPQPAVLKGSGTYTFNVTAIPTDWSSSAGAFQVYVNLSENPHPATWSPLADARKAITIPAAPAVKLSANDLAQASVQVQTQALTQCNGVSCF